MKLHAGHLIEHLQFKALLLTHPDRPPELLEPKDKRRPKLFGDLIKRIEAAPKYIFDSGNDKDPDQMDKVRKTATAMMDFDLFHLPFPSIWVEDPFIDNPDERRYYYFMSENYQTRRITVHHFARMPEFKETGEFTYVYTPYQFEKDLDITTDKWAWVGPDPSLHEGTVWWDAFVQPFREAMYASTKFLVTLATTNHIAEKDPGRPFKQRIPHKFREYPHVIIRVPEYVPTKKGEKTGDGTGAKRRMHLVAGYVYGKNTRPIEEQKLILPYWRGDQTIGVIERAPTLVKSRA
jgi:hypothetical protein